MRTNVRIAQAIFLLALLFYFLIPTLPAAEGVGALHWEKWSDEVFARAKKEDRFVLLDLEAVWCHWCHVMEEKTYSNPDVIRLLQSKYICVRVDQDARPDLANRYEDYGWPATVIFNSDGGEIVKRRGYIPPEQMISTLEAVIKDPSPGPSVQPASQIQFAPDAALSPDLRVEIKKVFFATYDFDKGGWSGAHKYLNWDSVELCLALSQTGDRRAEKMARQTLDAQRKLIDPIWGGVYQYSTDGDWDHPHFEKIMPMQAENLRIYSLAFALYDKPVYLETSWKIHDYLRDFLTTPDGAFYTSQDADLVPGEHSESYFKLNNAQRRRKGVPRVDQHIYSRENGLAINGILGLYDATGASRLLEEATTAAEWILAHRALGDGGFKHDSANASGPYLSDTLHMGRAFLHFYASTGDRLWLDRAESSSQFIDRHFRNHSQTNAAGFATADLLTKAQPPSQPQFDENGIMARFANLLFHYTGREEYRESAQHAMRYLATPEIARGRFSAVGPILLADRELGSDPLHIAVVGGKKDAQAKRLFAAALKFPLNYKQTDWFDPGEKSLATNSIPFPELDHAAGYVCGKQSCSPPVTDPARLHAVIERALK
ncbi:MAG: DUF255 domain-containing protein [Verrucomicrobiota bacterium]